MLLELTTLHYLLSYINCLDYRIINSFYDSKTYLLTFPTFTSIWDIRNHDYIILIFIYFVLINKNNERYAVLDKLELVLEATEVPRTKVYKQKTMKVKQMIFLLSL